ncbi:MAG TPA: transcription antitermination factor NusB [Dehalococcoidia bacterium]|nr:transcription antitermination factor NusB [Dehalococcoidia bacterium]
MIGGGTVSTRRDTRILSLQILCEVDTVNHDVEIVLSQIRQDNEMSSKDDQFVCKLVNNVLENLQQLDNMIITYAPSWPINQMPVVDRNLLRMAIGEIEWVSSTPNKVVVNEAVEIAKIFGSDRSPSFVNGVLGSFLTEKCGFKS